MSVESYEKLLESIDYEVAKYLVCHSPLKYSGVSQGILADCKVFIQWLRNEANNLDIMYIMSDLHDDGIIQDDKYKRIKHIFDGDD